MLIKDTGKKTSVRKTGQRISNKQKTTLERVPRRRQLTAAKYLGKIKKMCIRFSNSKVSGYFEKTSVSVIGEKRSDDLVRGKPLCSRKKQRKQKDQSP